MATSPVPTPRSRTPLLAIGAAVLALVIVGGAVLALVIRPGGSTAAASASPVVAQRTTAASAGPTAAPETEAPTASPEPTATPTPSPTASPDPTPSPVSEDPVVADLIAHAPPRTTFCNATTLDVTRSRADGGIVCLLTDATDVGIFYYRYPDVRALRADHNALRRASGVKEGTGNCKKGRQAAGTWRFGEDSKIEGHYLCTPGSSTNFIYYTFEDRLTAIELLGPIKSIWPLYEDGDADPLP